MNTRALTTAAALTALLLIGCGGSSSNTPVSPTPGGGGGASADVTITITGMNGGQSFSPNPATARVGQTVAWKNADSVTHTATANGGAFNTGNIAAGATSSPVMMSTAGSFDYHCALHPSMVGTLTVTP
jgi:plastocyanin